MSESPLRQQIAEAIHKWLCDACVAGPPEWHCEPDDISGDESRYFWAADAVVALLNLTEERTEWAFADEPEDDRTVYNVRGDIHEQAADEGTSVLQRVVRVYTGPWLPSTPPDTSSSEPA